MKTLNRAFINRLKGYGLKKEESLSNRWLYEVNENLKFLLILDGLSVTLLKEVHNAGFFDLSQYSTRVLVAKCDCSSIYDLDFLLTRMVESPFYIKNKFA